MSEAQHQIKLDAQTPDSFQLMQQVVREMKEIPELPSEKPKDVSHLLRVSFPNTGGMLTDISGHAYPYKGFPYFEIVEKIDLIKKFSRSTISSLFHSIKRRNKIVLLTAIFVPWLFSDLLKAGLYSCYRTVERFRIKRERYCDAMRELHRAFSIEFEGERAHDREVRLQLRDTLCMILEFDNAYRFRLQDVIVELNKESLKKNPSKELLRLLSLLQTRENGQTVKDTWTLLKTFIPIILFAQPKLKKQFTAILSELDLSKMALSDEDKWYCAPRTDYICGFRNNPSQKEKEIIEGQIKKVKKEEAQIQIREESTKAHQELFARQRKEVGISEEVENKIKEAELNLQREVNAKALQEYNERHGDIINSFFTQEQREIMGKHLKEIEEMNDYYNSKLQAVEK